MVMTTHLLHGFRVESELNLGHTRTEGESDVTVVVRVGGRRPVPPEPPQGGLLQEFVHPQMGRLYSTAAIDADIVLLRVHGHVDFEIAPDLRTVTVWIDPGSTEEMAAILLTGLMLSVLITLRGELVLHASAVEVAGESVALVADSGMGKSTLAALLCHQGARFVTDDVLHVRIEGDGKHRCWLGATENRLRRDASSLLGPDPDVTTRRSTDGRVVWTPPESMVQLGPLRAVVMPIPDRGAERLVAHRLDPAHAILELTRRPRVQGWQEPVGRTAMFRNLSQLVVAVPVLRVVVPWGPPFSPALATDLQREIDRVGG